MKCSFGRTALTGLGVLLVAGCGSEGPSPSSGAATVAGGGQPEVLWNSSTVYFLLTDRFVNGDPSNDFPIGRADDGEVLRGYQGGDLRGVLEKIEEGYFEALGVDALWMTPFVEQIAGSVDEGTGKTYAFHGYWTRDWTAVDPNLGTMRDLRAVVEAAHARGIRVVMDAVLQHPGPATDVDEPWPSDWIRGEPNCAHRTYASTVSCNLVPTLPDFITESDDPVELPGFLLEKWEAEGRLQTELDELDDWFARTGYPRAPRYHVMKWLVDWVRELGFDGYRVDTAKHFEETVSAEWRHQADLAFAEWKAANPDQVLDDAPFWMMGEVYNYDITNGRDFDYGDRVVDFFAYGYDALINFNLKRRDGRSLEEVFSSYSSILRDGALRGKSVLNYLDSHDDGSPWDRGREDPYGAAIRLLLAPGGAQIYYGDELARPLDVEGARGDANLRSFMNWGDLESDRETRDILVHWQRLGRFRHAHPAVGAGAHAMLQAEPYVFSRILEADGISDRVVVGVDMPGGAKTIPVGDVFDDGAVVVDAYTGSSGVVTGGAVTLDTPAGVVLLAEG